MRTEEKGQQGGHLPSPSKDLHPAAHPPHPVNARPVGGEIRGILLCTLVYGAFKTDFKEFQFRKTDLHLKKKIAGNSPRKMSEIV